jgi:hypothetical protein
MAMPKLSHIILAGCLARTHNPVYGRLDGVDGMSLGALLRETAR